MSQPKNRLPFDDPPKRSPRDVSQGEPDNKAARRKHRSVVIRDLIIFQIKLLLDGLKDIVLSPLAILAAGLDFISPSERRGRRFYAVLTLGERFDRWLSLFSVSEKAAMHEQGLFGASRAGSDTLLGKLEEMVLGRTEDEDPEEPDDEGGDE